MLKRVTDLILSSLALAVLSPALLIVGAGIWFTMGLPVFFIQRRPGFNEKEFNLVKFRTMSSLCDQSGSVLPDAARLTRPGKILRSTSLDELPELWNVLRGDMSLVGPRPLLIEYLPLYTKEQMRRHEVRPGITGWAQVHGRNAISWEDKFKLDVWYVDNRSFWLDIKILLLTVLKVFGREGISGAGEATMSKFTGTVVGNRER